jgi:hypothetical protein
MAVRARGKDTPSESKSSGEDEEEKRRRGGSNSTSPLSTVEESSLEW